MFRERIPDFIRRPVVEAVVGLVARVEGKDREQVRFEFRAKELSKRYLPGDLSLREALHLADEINASGEFPGRDMADAFERYNLEKGARHAAPQV